MRNLRLSADVCTLSDDLLYCSSMICMAHKWSVNRHSTRKAFETVYNNGMSWPQVCSHSSVEQCLCLRSKILFCENSMNACPCVDVFYVSEALVLSAIVANVGRSEWGTTANQWRVMHHSAFGKN